MSAVLDVLVRETWMDQGACLEGDPDWWFSDRPRHRLQAKRICRQECPVREQCLSYALSRGETYGIWGGLDEDERAAIYDHARRAASHERRHA